MFKYVAFPVLLFFVLSANAQYPDIHLLQKIHSDSSLRRDHFFRFISNTDAPLSLGTPLVCLSTAYISNDRTSIQNAWKLTGSMMLNQVLTSGFKFTFQRQRPYVRHGDLIVKKQVTGPFSFPSGHTSSTFALATSLTLWQPKWYVAGPSFLYAGLVAWSRMYLGVHYPSDVWGGIIIGVGSSFLIWGIDRLGK